MALCTSWCILLDKTKLTLRQIALFGMLGALTFGAKFAMQGLPNIEPVSLFLMIFAAVFGLKALYPTFLYVLLEVLFFGINLWTINYLYVWPILALLSICMRKMESPVGWAILSGGFGLMFGLLCAPVYLFTGGPGFALSWWISGIPFDLLHAAGNFIMALVLFAPLRQLLDKLYKTIQ